MDIDREIENYIVNQMKDKYFKGYTFIEHSTEDDYIQTKGFWRKKPTGLVIKWSDMDWKTYKTSFYAYQRISIFSSKPFPVTRDIYIHKDKENKIILYRFNQIW